ncbi:hypothetical protein [Chamaesiphon sp. OTE_75_metabat_556]|uniref:hypothetical protein n=1 Tax=Chamaesiphon sp. OTE_75_metabat_556 TaxID=2964692 RepID=UPI00286D4CD3|nr:hypothetical protein [Chamaesiphon sp. OTE_75_metabat_556]
MIYKVDYSLMGWMQSVGHISIGRNSSYQIESFGTIYVVYDLLGRVSTIDGRECGYRGWFSPLLSIGDIPISLEKPRWWGGESKRLAVGNLKLGYGKWNRIESIGNLKIGYGKFGRMTEIITAGDRDLTHLQQIALTLILIEKAGASTAD